MVYIENLMEGVSLQFYAVGYKSALKVTHSALTLSDARFKDANALVGESVDSGRNPPAFT